MSTAKYILMSLTALGLIGCDDEMMDSTPARSGLSERQMAPTSSTPLKPAPQPRTGKLQLEGMLRVPGVPFVTIASIKGEVTYSLTSMPYRRALRVNLDLSTDATLVPEGMGPTVWHVKGKSHDQLFLLREGSIILKKNYAVMGSENQMILWLRFLLTPEGIGLKEMQLEIQRLAGRNRQPLPMQKCFLRVNRTDGDADATIT